ncbi:MAG: hypothetical protein RIK87_13140 [Fuerstiella sp.]
MKAVLNVAAAGTVCGCLALICLATGCAQPESRHDQLTRSSAPLPPVDRRADNYEWVKRLIASPPLEGVQQVSFSGATSTLPVPIPPSVAAGGTGYTVIIDPQAQLVWVNSFGGNSGSAGHRYGPWRPDHPDVAHLLHSLTNPPTQTAAVQ